MKRLREISRYECEVRVLRNGFCGYPKYSLEHFADFFSGRQVDSNELVPGDIYEVSDPSLTQYPCDSLLLAGDCIVNESMLTGLHWPFQTWQRLRLTKSDRRIRASFKNTSNG